MEGDNRFDGLQQWSSQFRNQLGYRVHKIENRNVVDLYLRSRGKSAQGNLPKVYVRRWSLDDEGRVQEGPQAVTPPRTVEHGVGKIVSGDQIFRRCSVGLVTAVFSGQNEDYLLTAGHVVQYGTATCRCSDSSSCEARVGETLRVPLRARAERILPQQGSLKVEADAAIVRIEKGVAAAGNFWTPFNPTPASVGPGDQVLLRNHFGHNVTATVIAPADDVEVTMDGQVWDFAGHIRIQRVKRPGDTTDLLVGGDSGALVVTKIGDTYRPVGIAVARANDAPDTDGVVTPWNRILTTSPIAAALGHTKLLEP